MKYYLKFLCVVKRNLKIAIPLIIFLSYSAAFAQSPRKSSLKDNNTWKRFSVSMGGFISGLNNDVILGSQNLGLGLSVNIEDALGLETSAFVLRGEVHYNFGKRGQQSAGFGYFGFFRKAQKIIESEIEIGEETFPLGTEINTRFNMQIFKGSYCYSFYLDDRVKIGASFGLYLMPVSFSTSALGLSEEVMDANIPLPVLGFGIDFAIRPKLILKQSIDIFYLKISSFVGSITDLNIKLEHNTWKHFGFGMGFNSYRLHVSNDMKVNSLINMSGDIKTSFTGLLIYAKYYF